MPGLFDIPPASDAYADIISKERSKQFSPNRPLNHRQMIAQAEKCSSRDNELEYISFGSGSSGNCAYIGVRSGKGILIDAGVDTKNVMDALADNYILPENIVGIILTHDHSDHVHYAYNILRHHRHIKLYCTLRALNGLLRRHSISSRIKDYHQPIFKEFEFECGPFKITPFEVSHDGSDNVGFNIQFKNHNFVVATDMGIITERADHYIRQADTLMIESNYDSDMLAHGTYPEYLKARIRSERGHLDNEVTASYLAEIWTPRLSNIYLCHLSNDNNTPQTAVGAVTSALNARGITTGDASGSATALNADVQIYPLPRYISSPLFILRIKDTPTE